MPSSAKSVLVPGLTPPAVTAPMRPGGPLAGYDIYSFYKQDNPLYPNGVEYYQNGYGDGKTFFDQQSQLKVWMAPRLPMHPVKGVEQFTPDTVRSYRGNGPFPVIRTAIKDPVYTLDCGVLAPSLYVVRIIATADKNKLRPFRLPVYVAMKVNDKLDGGWSTYRVRIGYSNDFFSLAEIYFHAPVQRAYQAQVWVDDGSAIDLLVHTLSLDNVMTGAQFKPWKKRRTLVSDEKLAQIRTSYSESEQQAIASIPTLSKEERLARDEMLWNWMPPLNAQGGFLGWDEGGALGINGLTPGVPGKTKAQIEEEFGKWTSPGGVGHQVDNNLGFTVGYMPSVFLVNSKLGLTYTLEDLAQHHPLPDPYPYKDVGNGLFFPDPDNPGKGHAYAPIAEAVHYRYRQAGLGWQGAATLWVKSGNENIGRDTAVLLVRFAYQFPTIDASTFLWAVTCQPRNQGYDSACYNRHTKSEWMFNYDAYLAPLTSYDLIYDYIKGNQELADSLHRFIPSIKTPQDVIAFLDAYLVQHLAKRTMRGHDHTWKSAIATIGASLGNPEIADTWVKPYADSLLGFVINDTDRNGTKRLGSSFYCHDEGAAEHASALDSYVRAGGSPSLSLIHKTRRPIYQAQWTLDIMLGGWDWLRIGDVTGPGEYLSRIKGWMSDEPALAWPWTGEPRYAWIIKHFVGRRGETDQQWKALEEATATIKRAPWLDNTSRVIDNWAGILETGVQHDDPRFRRAAYVRVGKGSGHSHADRLDLHMLSHGLQVNIEGGQRSGYSKPNDKLLRVHSTVEVQGPKTLDAEDTGDSYIRVLTDAPGSRYLQAVADPPQNSTLFTRQIAMIDVDEGQDSQPLTLKQQVFEEPLPKGVVPGRSYLLDVFRVRGGQMHSYGFNGTINDDFQWNADQVRTVKHQAKPTTDWKSPEGFLSPFELTGDSKQSGIAPDHLVATWRMVRFEKDTFGKTSEEAVLGKNFDPESPRRFTRLHLLGTQGMQVLKADVIQTMAAYDINSQNPGQPPRGYRWTRLYARNLTDAENLQTAFVGIIEPYQGDPFIESTRLLTVDSNEIDAQRAVALEVKLNNGRTDWVFADGRPEQTRQVGPVKVSGEYAMISRDSKGLLMASLSGGTMLQSPQVTITIKQRQYAGRITRVMHDMQAVEIDTATFGPIRTGHLIHIEGPSTHTSFTLAEPAQQAGNATRLIFTRDRLESMNASGAIKYAYAVGDMASTICYASIRRLDDGSYEIAGNADLSIHIPNCPVFMVSASELAEHQGVVRRRPSRR